MGKKKIYGAALDNDETLTNNGISVVQTVDDNALPNSAKQRMATLREKYVGLHHTGKLTPDDQMHWMSETVETYVDCGLTLSAAAETFTPTMLRSGVKESLVRLRRHGFRIAIVSFGIADFIEAFFTNCGIRNLVDEIYAAKMIVSNDVIVGYDPNSVVIPKNKGDWSMRFAEEYEIHLDDLYAAGDSPGDHDLGHHKHKRIGIAKHDDHAERIAPYMGHVIITDDFTPITDWILKQAGIVTT